MKIYIDGTLHEEADAKISVFDHGLLYGDGVFEGIRFYNNRVFELDAHISRLFDSAKSILLTIPMTEAEMTEAVLETIRENGLSEGYVRLVITRGEGTLGLSPFLCPKASVIVIASSISLYPEEKYQNGLVMVTCSTRRPTPASLSPQVKSLNYLNNVMAKVEAIHGGGEEGLMLNEQGFVAECTGDNIFIVRNGEVITPPVSAGSLDGITRQAVFRICQELGIPIREANLTRHDIYIAHECFLTGTAAEVIAAIELDRRTIGDGKPGEITQKVITAFRKLVGSTGTPIPAGGS
ncbi:branched-chain-amino-acid transaminase [Verrucomicrobiales bacterium]|nr:branched-chain-amino-acid transaminase [Verrucomicrobiales bacterium]